MSSSFPEAAPKRESDKPDFELGTRLGRSSAFACPRGVASRLNKTCDVVLGT